MMRVVGKTGFVAVALSLVVTSSVMAAGQPLRDWSSATSAIPSDGGFSPRNFTGTGFEQSEGFGLGTVSAHPTGWKCLGANNATPPGPRCAGTPGQVVNKGNGSQHGFAATQNFNHPGGTFIGARSPTIKSPTTLGTLNWDFKMDDNFGADYFMLPQAPSQTLVVAYFGYRYDGYLYSVNYDAPGGTFGPHNLGLWDTSWNTYQMVLSHPGFADTTITYWAGPNKDSLTQLCDLDSGQCSFTPAGNQFEEVLLISDNFQNTGLGSFSGDNLGPNTPGNGVFDNIVLKPEPSTLVMLGAGLVLALRRRRAH